MYLLSKYMISYQVRVIEFSIPFNADLRFNTLISFNLSRVSLKKKVNFIQNKQYLEPARYLFP